MATRKRRQKPLFDWTGRGSLILEQTASGPVIINFDDLQLTAALLQAFLNSAPEFDVSAYDERTGRTAKRLLKGDV